MMFLVEQAAITIAIMALAISFIISIIYKMMVNQDKAKDTKEKIKSYQEKIKKLGQSGKQKEAMDMQKKMSELSLSQMKSTFKPMFVTMIVVIPIFVLVFPGLYAIDSSDDSPLSGFKTKGYIQLDDNGNGMFSYKDETHNITYTIQDEGKVFESGSYTWEYGKYSSRDNTVAVSRVVANSPVPIPFAGNSLGWLGWYILCSVAFSFMTRKLLGVV